MAGQTHSGVRRTHLLKETSRGGTLCLVPSFVFFVSLDVLVTMGSLTKTCTKVAKVRSTNPTDNKQHNYATIHLSLRRRLRRGGLQVLIPVAVDLLRAVELGVDRVELALDLKVRNTTRGPRRPRQGGPTDRSVVRLQLETHPLWCPVGKEGHTSRWYQVE